MPSGAVVAQASWELPATFSLNLRPAPQGETHTQHLYQLRTCIRHVIDPKEGPPTAVLLSGHRIKPAPDDLSCPYTHRLTYPSTLI